MDLFIFTAILVLGGGIAILLKKEFNKVIKKMESIYTRLMKIEES